MCIVHFRGGDSGCEGVSSNDYYFLEERKESICISDIDDIVADYGDFRNKSKVVIKLFIVVSIRSRIFVRL